MNFVAIAQDGISVWDRSALFCLVLGLREKSQLRTCSRREHSAKQKAFKTSKEEPWVLPSCICLSGNLHSRSQRRVVSKMICAPPPAAGSLWWIGPEQPVRNGHQVSAQLRRAEFPSPRAGALTAWQLSAPHGLPERSPLHPSYGAGQATVAGACVTIVRALFAERTPMPNPVVHLIDGLTLVPYSGEESRPITPNR